MKQIEWNKSIVRALEHMNKKKPRSKMCSTGLSLKNLGNYLLSHMKICSIIGEKELNFRVRNGIGCTLLSMVTKKYANI